MLSISEKAELRESILVYLAERHPLSFDNGTICKMIKRKTMVDFEFDQNDCNSAIAVLKDQGLISGPAEASLISAIIPWCATAAGMLYAEMEGLL